MPTHPAYEGSLDARETAKRLAALKETEEEVAHAEADFHWDSDEEANETSRMNGGSGSKGKGKAVDGQ